MSIGVEWAPSVTEGWRLSRSATAAESALAYRVSSLLAVPEELFVRHNRPIRMIDLAMSDISLVVRNPDHELRRFADRLANRATASNYAVSGP